jgi:hypothetical protein
MNTNHTFVKSKANALLKREYLCKYGKEILEDILTKVENSEKGEIPLLEYEKYVLPHKQKFVEKTELLYEVLGLPLSTEEALNKKFAYYYNNLNEIVDTEELQAKLEEKELPREKFYKRMVFAEVCMFVDQTYHLILGLKK